LGIAVDDVECADNLISFTQLDACVSIESAFEFLNFLELIQSLVVAVGLEVEEGDVSLDLAGPLIYHTVVHFIYLLCLLQHLQSFLNAFDFFKPLAQGYGDVSDLILRYLSGCATISTLRQVLEYLQSLLLEADSLAEILLL
jgi:hypothetical protein